MANRIFSSKEIIKNNYLNAPHLIQNPTPFGIRSTVWAHLYFTSVLNYKRKGRFQRSSKREGSPCCSSCHLCAALCCPALLTQAPTEMFQNCDRDEFVLEEATHRAQIRSSRFFILQWPWSQFTANTNPLQQSLSHNRYNTVILNTRWLLSYLHYLLHVLLSFIHFARLSPLK